MRRYYNVKQYITSVKAARSLANKQKLPGEKDDEEDEKKSVNT